MQGGLKGRCARDRIGAQLNIILRQFSIDRDGIGQGDAVGIRGHGREGVLSLNQGHVVGNELVAVDDDGHAVDRQAGLEPPGMGQRSPDGDAGYPCQKTLS